MALVLCVDTEDALQSSRKLILEQAGHHVVAVTGERELIAACGQCQFEIAVIGQAVPENEKHRALRLIKEHCPQAKVLELVEYGTERTLTDANDWLEVPVHPPSELAHRVWSLAAKRSQSHAP